MSSSAVFILHEGFCLTSLTTVMDAFWVANWLTGKQLYDMQTYSASGGPVRGFAGISVDTLPLSDLNPRSVRHVFAVSSFEPYNLARSDIAAVLRSAYRYGASVHGIETGAIALAHAGLLDGREAAVHWVNREGFEEAYPDVELSEAPVAGPDRCKTCAGGTSAMDLALELIELEQGQRLAAEVRRHLFHPRVPMGSPQRGDPVVEAARKIMRDSLTEPVSIVEIAERVGTTPRTLARRFESLGETPRGHYLTLRLTRAQNLLQQTDLAVGEIAAETGFDSLPAFSRAYRSFFGLPPSRDRRQTVTATPPRVLGA